ncbi:MAG: cytochrome b [Pseudorhodoplanes sp.]
MTYGTQVGGYSSAAKLLHWLIALCVLAILPVAWWMNNTTNQELGGQLYTVHKSLGMTILILMTLRIVYRLAAGAPAAYAGLNRLEKALSSAVHGLLYLLLFLMPLVGWVANSAYGMKTPFWGLFEFPQIIAKNEALSERLFTLHKYVGWVVAAVVVLHVAGALKHYVIDRDGVLQRMLPRSLGGI